MEIQAQAPQFAWVKRAGGTEADAASRVTVDANGNSYVTGIFRGIANFGTITLTSIGSVDIFIAKYDSSGNVLWAKRAGGPLIDASKNIEIDGSGNSYITGEFEGSTTFGSTTLTSTGSYDLFVAKYDVSGNVLWAKHASGAGLQMGRGIAVDAKGDCLITGYFENTATFGSTTLTSSGSYDVFIAKYDATGNFMWAKRAGSSGEDYGRNVAVDGSGNSYVTGTFRGLASFGSTMLTSSGAEDIFVAKYDSAGNVLWAKRAGGVSKDASVGIAVDSSGNSSIAGEFLGSATFGSTTLTSTSSLPDIFTARYDALGNVLWAKQAGGSSSDFGRNIAVDRSGHTYISGEFEGSASFGSTTLTSNGGVDIFIAKYDVSGNMLFAKSAGGNMEERAPGISVDTSGNAFISGYFLGNASFGSTTITSSGSSDIYIAKLSTVTSFPVHLLTFTAKQQNKNIHLNWQVENEQNFAAYEVQRSTNGREFSKIGMVKAVNANSYNYTDPTSNFKPQTIYYRLKMLDKDGKFTYSKIETVKLNKSHAFNIYPNPAISSIQLQFSKTLTGKVDVEIVDVTGKVMIRKGYDVSGNNITISTYKLGAGSYSVRVMYNNEEYVQQVVVVRGAG